MRDAIIFLGTALLLIAGAVQLARIEVSQGEQLAARAHRQQTRTVPIPAQRGSILDTQGRILASSLRKPSLFMDAAKLSDVRFAAYTLAPILGEDSAAFAKELEKLAQKKNQDGTVDQHIWIRRHLSPAQADLIREVCGPRGLDAFRIQEETIREYPQGTLAAHVLGYLNTEGGKCGIEGRYDSLLSGTPGRSAAIIDESGNRLARIEDEYVQPQHGKSIVLTIDSHIQAIAEQFLNEAVKKFEAEWATAVVMDPRTGEVLALANLPTFDPAQPVPPALQNQVEKALARTRNRALFDMYEPGSIFKPFVAARAMQDGRTFLGEVFEIDGPVHYFGRRPIQDSHTHDRLTLEQIISESSNIGMGLLGERLGNKKLSEYVSEFGFGRPTEIGLPAEEKGILRPVKKWTNYSTQSIPIGQEIAVTAIQITTAFCVLANDGVLLRPRIVRGVLSASGNTEEDHSTPIVLARLLDSDVALQFRRAALAETVRSGTGKTAALPDYQVFGKTGTAQVAGRSGYEQKSYMSSFVGGAPLDQPRAVVLVSLYKPKMAKGYYGSEVAAPVAGKILAETMRYLRVAPDIVPEALPALPSRQ
ncbi:MAG: peptidoglycan D,D-transpeptidase FtsI family protein [Phycisphaerae bacterium]